MQGMIAGLKGIVLSKKETCAIIDIQGVRYEVECSSSDIAKIAAPGNTVELWTRLVQNDTSLTLYGFRDYEGRQLFDLLLTVTGVGPKLALNILGAARPADIIAAITAEKPGAFPKVPRLGKKTASRIVLDLKSKVSQVFPGSGESPVQSRPADDIALQALIELGYATSEARAALENVSDKDPGQRVKQALHNLAAGHLPPR